MRYIIGFVLFGLLVYAGGFFLIAGANEAEYNALEPVNFNAFTDPGALTEGAYYGTLDQTVGKLGRTDKTSRDFLGIEFGEPIVQQYYVIPAGRVEEDIKEQTYMAVCVTDDADAAALDEITFRMPQSPDALKGKTGLEFKGRLVKMDDQTFDDVRSYFYSHEQLIGIGTWDLQQVPYYNNRICRFTLYIGEAEDDYLIAVVIGAAALAVGIGGIILLIVLKIRGKNAY